MPEGPEVEGNINGDLPIQCNDIRYDTDRNENAVVVVEGDKGGENGRDIDGNSRSYGIPHILLDWSWLQLPQSTVIPLCSEQECCRLPAGLIFVRK